MTVDTETTGLFTDDPCPHCPLDVHITIVSCAWEGGSLAVPFAVSRSDGEPDLDNAGEAVWDGLLLWLSRQRLVMHNCKFDLHQLADGAPNGWRGRRLVNSVVWDTSLANWLMWPMHSPSLKPTAERLWGPEAVQAAAKMKEALLELPRGQQRDFWRVPWARQGAYAKADAELTLKLYARQMYELDRDADPDYDLRGFIGRELEVAKILYAMEERGIGFKVDEAGEIADALADERRRIEAAAPYKLTRNEALKHWASNDAALDDIEFEQTPTGKLSLDHRGMEKAARAGLAYAKEFLRFLDLDRALSLWFGPGGWPSKVGGDGRLRTDYRQITANYHGVPSGNGRFSSSRVNLMAIPKAEKTVEKGLPDVRALFVARPGHELIGLDLSNAELRIAASLSGCGLMIDAFEAGSDPHTATAKRLFGVTERDRRWDTLRKHAKTATFAILYGSGAGALSETFAEGGHDIDAIEARRLIKEFDVLYPELRATMIDAERRAAERGYIVLAGGRRRYFSDSEPAWKAFNTAVQGGVAEFMKTAMIWVEANRPGTMILQIHDELVLELPGPDALGAGREIAAELARQATELFGITMVMKAKIWNRKEQ